MVLGVRDVDDASLLGDPLRLPEARLAEPAVGEPREPAARDCDDGPVGIREHDPMVSGVGDGERPVGEHDRATGERERARIVLLADEPNERLRVERSHRERGLDRSADRLGGGLARPHPDDAPRRVEHVEARPGARAPAVPDLHRPVDGDRMANRVLRDDRSQAFLLPLHIELRRVNSDDDDRLALEAMLDGRKDGERVDAVDAAARPEVDDDDLPPELLERQRVVDVEPRSGSAEAWRDLPDLPFGARAGSEQEKKHHEESAHHVLVRGASPHGFWG